jgi:hypothetical protein
LEEVVFSLVLAAAEPSAAIETISTARAIRILPVIWVFSRDCYYLFAKV